MKLNDKTKHNKKNIAKNSILIRTSLWNVHKRQTLYDRNDYFFFETLLGLRVQS